MSNTKRRATRGNYAPKSNSRAARAAAFRARNASATTLVGLAAATRSVSRDDS